MKLHTALLTLLLVAGCSKTNETVAPPGSSGAGSNGNVGTNTTDPVTQCFERCDTTHKKGLEKFDALDTCVEFRCKQGYDDPASPKKACAPLDQAKISYGYEPTDKCMADMCCAEAEACANDPECSAASTCYSQCSAMR